MLIIQEAEDLTSAGHYASVDIREQLSELTELWQGLEAASQEKHERLDEAYQVSDSLMNSALTLISHFPLLDGNI